MGSTILELAALIGDLEKWYVPSGTQREKIIQLALDLVEGKLEMEKALQSEINE